MKTKEMTEVRAWVMFPELATPYSAMSLSCCVAERLMNVIKQAMKEYI